MAAFQASLFGRFWPSPEASPRSKRKSKESKRIKELERDVRRKDRALAEATALLVLKKKVQAIWGDADDDTPEGSET